MLGNLGLGLALLVSSTGTADQRQPDRGQSSDTGVNVVEPVGKVWIDAGNVEGETGYVRRTKVREGMTMVEVSNTPFMTELPGVQGAIRRPAAEPAGW